MDFILLKKKKPVSSTGFQKCENVNYFCWMAFYIPLTPPPWRGRLFKGGIN
jgi:hypothetical protein